jgi:dTDP-4-dehydrorhamnose 3,5-epimerase
MDEVSQMQGISVVPLKVIPGKEGSVMHACKKSDESFTSFGEAYFSTVNHGAIKGWKKHKKMVSNLIVPAGSVQFVFFDDRENSDTQNQFFQITLSLQNYCRLHVEPCIWMAFKGMTSEVNLILNLASIVHDPSECLVEPLERFNPPFVF